MHTPSAESKFLHLRTRVLSNASPANGFPFSEGRSGVLIRAPGGMSRMPLDLFPCLPRPAATSPTSFLQRPTKNMLSSAIAFAKFWNFAMLCIAKSHWDEFSHNFGYPESKVNTLHPHRCSILKEVRKTWTLDNEPEGWSVVTAMASLNGPCNRYKRNGPIRATRNRGVGGTGIYQKSSDVVMLSSYDTYHLKSTFCNWIKRCQKLI